MVRGVTECPAPKAWLSAYLYHGGSGDRFLREAVAPFVTLCLDRGSAERFFFVRGVDEGQHIRLRLKGEPRVLEKVLRPSLDEHFEAGSRGSVRYVAYHPETLRYGGPLGVLIAERQFEWSSRAALAALELGGSAGYDRITGTAIHLHVGFAGGLGMEPAEARRFFDYVSELFIVGALGSLSELGVREFRKRRGRTHEAFESAFRRQSPDLEGLPALLTAAARDELDDGDSWFVQWVDRSREIGRSLRRALSRGRLLPPRDQPPALAVGLPDREGEEFWPILASYVHMTNNRLGIHNRDESYIGYLIARSLEPHGMGTRRS